MSSERVTDSRSSEESLNRLTTNSWPLTTKAELIKMITCLGVLILAVISRALQGNSFGAGGIEAQCLADARHCPEL
jgi:hypothetical protein